jgi:hypothetical protein
MDVDMIVPGFGKRLDLLDMLGRTRPPYYHISDVVFTLMLRYVPSSRYAKSVPVVLLSMFSVLAAYISLTARGSVLILRECRKPCCTVPARGVLIAA